MVVTTGWDALVLTFKTTPDGIELRIGAVFVLVLVWVVSRILNWFEDDPGPKLTG